MDLPPTEELDNLYTDPTSDVYERLRKWVSYSVKRLLKPPCTIALNVPLEQFTTLPPKEIIDRLEVAVTMLCVQWVEKQKSQLESPTATGLTRALCEVPLDYTFLVEELVLIAKHRENGLLFFSDANRTHLHGVSESEFQEYWRWNLPNAR